jgi:hypothetical protein
MTSGLILDLGAAITCPHGGQASPVTNNTRVLVDGMPALLVSDSFPIVGCAFEAPRPHNTGPQPCLQTMWNAPAARVLINGHPVLVSTSSGQCLSAEHFPQGPPTTSGVQPRVTAQ